MQRYFLLFTTLALFTLAACTPAGEANNSAAADIPVKMTDWQFWRGPTLNGIAPADQKPVTDWSESKNIVWKTKLPGYGHSTPCIIGNKMILTTCDKPATREEDVTGTVTMRCYDKTNGKELWATKIYSGLLPSMHKDNSYCSATTVYNGKYLYFTYQTPKDVRLTAVDLDGKIAWDKTAGLHINFHGYSNSATVWGDLVFVGNTGDRREEGCYPRMVAFNATTGEIVWDKEIPTEDETHETYASPLAFKVAGKPQLVIIGPDKTWSFDPATGDVIWECEGPQPFNGATPCFDEKNVYATGGYPKRRFFKLAADGKGDITGTERVLWDLKRPKPRMGYVPTPLYSDGLVYQTVDEGFFRCHDAETGKILWEDDRTEDERTYYSSPIMANGNIYVFDRQGGCRIYKHSKEMNIVAKDLRLEDGVFASPVFLDNKMYLRTLGALYCIGE